MKKKSLILGVIILAIAVCLFTSYRKNDKLEVSTIIEKFEKYPDPKMEIKIGNSRRSEKVEVLRELILPEQWKKTPFSEWEDLLLSIRLNEGYEIRVYQTYVEVYDEYPKPLAQYRVYYKLSPEAIARIAEYVK